MRVPHSELALTAFGVGGLGEVSLTRLGAERVTFDQNNQWLLCYGGVARWCRFRSALFNLKAQRSHQQLLKPECLRSAKCCACVKTIHLTKAFQLCKQSASKASQKCTWYYFMLILSNSLDWQTSEGLHLAASFYYDSIFCCIPLWELGNFCKHTTIDLLVVMPKWINMRTLLQQRVAVRHWSSFLSALSKAS